ncbi:MAG TPA: type I-E CRISPR-associated protein Cse1/CasA [Pyrinomonadaceae bacterium]|jgi:CRISPR system Cascade subunit CasA|nr:type I-E CRISPR-associated protein Cse1/CasA [Pyrinomonadaceae bacterium]
MPHSFNLPGERWIPCVLHDGQQEDLSLLDALTRAPEVREVFDESPLVTVALHRLLLAVLHRNFGPANFKAWQSLWRAGKWDTEKLIAYFQQWRDSFDLFDNERPFYQVQMMNDAEHHPAVLLKQEAATGNNATLFDHSFSDAPTPLSPAEAARYLVARQAFSIGGGVGKPFNLCGATLTRGISLLALGDNLFETLALNLLVYNEEKPIANTSHDLPAWEHRRPAIPQKEGTPVSGYLDYLTWQSRRIHLIPEGEPIVVRRCQIQQNLRLPEAPLIFDPFKCYLLDKDKGFRPLPLSTSKALWRDSHTLFQQSAQTGKSAAKRPELFNQLARIDQARDEGLIEARKIYALTAYGFATDPGKAASVLLWSRERLPLPLRYLNDQALVERLGSALGFADEVARILRSSLRYLAKLLLAPGSDTASARQPDKNDIGNLAKSFAAESFYWARLEPHFKTLLIALPQDVRADDYDNNVLLYGERAVPSWALTLQRTAWAAFEETTHSLDMSARNLKAVASAERQFKRTLGAKMKEFMNQQSATVLPGGDE